MKRGPKVHMASTGGRAWTKCSAHVPADRVTGDRRQVTCARCGRERIYLYAVRPLYVLPGFLRKLLPPSMRGRIV